MLEGSAGRIAPWKNWSGTTLCHLKLAFLLGKFGWEKFLSWSNSKKGVFSWQAYALYESAEEDLDPYESAEEDLDPFFTPLPNNLELMWEFDFHSSF